MSYRVEASQTENKVKTHKMNTQVVYEHLQGLEEKLTFVDLPCDDFYANEFAFEKFGDNFNMIAYERNGTRYLELKNKNIVPKNIDYRHGDIFDMRGESIHWANIDTHASVTEKNINQIIGLILGIKMQKKSVLTINLVKNYGMAGKDFKENGLQEQIVKILYRLGHKKVSFFTCEYRSEQEGKKQCMTMIQSTFFIG